MRPRQSSLGIVYTAGGDYRDDGRFNEAEAIKPRNLPRPQPAACAARCFNEAEAIKPRNLPRPQPAACAARCFNEAEAIKPRNLHGLGQSWIVTCASMRPRQSSLGICRWHSSHKSSPSCFNEAEAIKPRNHPELAGNVEPRALDASMRPRQSSLGILRKGGSRKSRVSPCFNEAEAIKPRNPAMRSQFALAVSRFNEAEAIKPRNHYQP